MMNVQKIATWEDIPINKIEIARLREIRDEVRADMIAGRKSYDPMAEMLAISEELLRR